MIVAHVPNLFDRSRFQGRAIFVGSVDEARQHEPTTLFVDLDRCDDLAGFAAFAASGCRVVGFGPHVDSELHRRAADLGYDEILTRSVFFRRLPDLLEDFPGETPDGGGVDRGGAPGL